VNFHGTRIMRSWLRSRTSRHRRCVSFSVVVATCIACKSGPAESAPDPNAANDAVRLTTASIAEVASARSVLPAPGTPENSGTAGAPAAPPDWAVGSWRGTGQATNTQLQLPNNQGVQLAWLKDNGKQYTGQVKLMLTLATNGVATGELTGVLGTLSATGVWPSEGPLHLELRAATEATDVFHGALTITWDAQKRHGQASLRATSGDGQWLRTANLEVIRPS
jgi:hypothetical protein